MLLLKLTIADLKMILRNRQALLWALLFPIVMVAMFGLMGSFRDSTVRIAVVDHARDPLSNRLVQSLGDVPGFEIEVREDENAVRNAVRDGDIGYLLIIPENLDSQARNQPPASVSLIYDEGLLGGGVIVAVERFLDQVNLDLADAPIRLELNAEGVLSEDLTLMEFVLPGIALWSIMMNSVIGIAASMATYREKKIFRRIKVSPLRARTFFTAQVLAYMVLSLIQAATILGLGAVAFGVAVGGNLLVVAVLILVCNLVFLNLGFIIGVFSKTAAAASGLGNLVVFPVVVFSGIFFPPELLPGFLADIVRFLPVAPMIDVLRGVTIGAKTLADFPVQFAVIAGWIAVTSVAATRLFKFE